MEGWDEANRFVVPAGGHWSSVFHPMLTKSGPHVGTVPGNCMAVWALPKYLELDHETATTELVECSFPELGTHHRLPRDCRGTKTYNLMSHCPVEGTKPMLCVWKRETSWPFNWIISIPPSGRAELETVRVQGSGASGRLEVGSRMW